MDLVGKVIYLLFNMLSRLIRAFLPRSKSLLISWLLSPSAMILEPKTVKSFTVSIVSPSICHEVMGLDAMILVFEYWVLSQLFHSPLSHFIKMLFSSSLSAIRLVSSVFLRLLIFFPETLIPPFPLLFVMKWWDQMPWSSFFECWIFTLCFDPHQEAL